MVGFIVGVLVGTAILAYVFVLDVGLVLRTYERSESSTLPAVVVGAAAGLASAFAAVWYLRRVNHLGGTARRMLGLVGIAWSVCFVIAFAWTHPLGRDDELATPLETAVISYLLFIVVVAVVGFLPVAVFRLARSTHRPRDRVRVMHVRDKKPYFVPHCDCGWAGTPYDADEPRARDDAFRDARALGTNVASEVEYPLG
jgi:hypothetical protein